MTNISSNKTIAKNTLFLYFRMMFTMVVLLYTSRVNLSVLGIEDNGIYQVVGGTVAMFSFLNASLSGATSRFMTYEIGIGNTENIKKTFASALIIHIFLAFLIVVLAETVGIWFLENKMVIPETRMHAARIVYQFSIITCVCSILQVPYIAAIISHEEMSVFAYISILEVVLKLIICYLLYIMPFDKLVIFGGLTLVVSISIQLVYRHYCIRHFQECRFIWMKDMSIIRPMLTFSSWDLLGNFSVMARGQGVNLVMNTFFGPIINSAAGFSQTIGGAVLSFSNNFLTAMRPPIVKAYSQQNIAEMESLMINASKYSLALLLMLSIPFVYESTFILNVWLKTPPPYTDVFCVLELMLSLFSSAFLPLMFAIHATGRVRLMSLLDGSIWFLTLPFTYLFFNLGLSPITPYVIKLILLVFVVNVNVRITKKNIPKFDVLLYLKRAVYPAFTVCIIVFTITFVIYSIFDEGGLLRFLTICATSVISVSFSTYFILMNKTQRKKIRNIIRKIIKRKFHD